MYQIEYTKCKVIIWMLEINGGDNAKSITLMLSQHFLRIWIPRMSRWGEIVKYQDAHIMIYNHIYIYLSIIWETCKQRAMCLIVEMEYHILLHILQMNLLTWFTFC